MFTILTVEVVSQIYTYICDIYVKIGHISYFKYVQFIVCQLQLDTAITDYIKLKM